MWRKLAKDYPVLNEIIQWSITLLALAALIKSFMA